MMLYFVVVLLLGQLKTTKTATTQDPGAEYTTAADQICLARGYLNGAKYDAGSDTCICAFGFSGQLCEKSSLVDVQNTISQPAFDRSLANIEKYATDVQNMMDNHIQQNYNGLKTSVETVGRISSSLISMINTNIELAQHSVVNLTSLTQGITELTADIITGMRKTKDQLFAENKLQSTVESAEYNLIEMINIMTNKQSTKTKTVNPTGINTQEVSIAVVKVEGKKLPTKYSAQYGGFSLPYFDTFQDKQKKQNVSIQVLTYRESPHLYVTNPDVVGSSVIRVNAINKDGLPVRDIEDKDDPAEVGVAVNNIDSGVYADMTESSVDSGVYMSYVETNYTGKGFLLEIKLTTLKICDIYCKYGSFPDATNYDIFVKTKGKSRIITTDPLSLRVTFKNSLLKITVSPTKEDYDTIKPIVLTASCEDDRQDQEKRTKRSGLSKVHHQFRAAGLKVYYLNTNESLNWTTSENMKELSVDENRVQFRSHFFGTFSASMFFFGPSTIDFSKLFANFTSSLADSPYALAAIVGILVIFGLVTIPLRKLDKGDELMWSFLPLNDNPPLCAVVYYLAVETSLTSPRLMTSSVYVNLIGTNGTSGTRKLEDGTRQNFKRGTSSHFQMRLTRDIGDLKTLQIWHDNRDGKTAWKLQKVIVVSANSLKRFTFLCGSWLSLDCKDGKIWRTMDVLDVTNIETDTLFYNLSQQKLFDDHLWISLFKRPRYSRFTRVQRVWCLLGLLFLSMIASAMWFDQPDNQQLHTINVGPFKLNYKQFYVGIMSGIIALLPSLILVLIFRYRKLKDENEARCAPPWWFIFIAYALIFICVCVSGTFVFLYSLEWGGNKTLDWMVSFILSVFQSVVILEPVKAIVLAVIFACLLKSLGSKELSDRSLFVPTPPKSESIENITEIMTDYNYPSFPGTEKESEEQIVVRQRAQIDKKLWSKFQTWFGMFLYVVLVAVICSHNDVSTSYRQNEHLLQTLTPVNDLKLTSDIYSYINTTFARAIFPKWWETEDDGLLRSAYEQRFTLNAYNYRITMTRFRQLRVKGACTIPKEMERTVDTCVPSFNEDTEETLNFCTSWRPINETCFDENEEFQYSFLNSRDDDYLKPAADLPYTGDYGTYGPGGYYIDLGPKESLVWSYLDRLRENKWIDYRTRVLFLDVVTYNANSRLFSHIKVVFELPTTGSITVRAYVWSSNMYPYVYPLDYVVLALQLIFVVVWCVRFVLYIIYLVKSRGAAVWAIYTYLRLFELTFGGAAIVFCILRINATLAAIVSLRESIGRYVSFELVRVYDDAYQGCLAGLLFIIILDLLEPLEFNYHFFLLRSSLKKARCEVASFFLIIILELLAFASLLYLMIGRQHEYFRSMVNSISTLINTLLAMMKYNTSEFDDALTKFFVGLFAISLTITMINVFITLLNITFNETKEALANGTLKFDQQLNDHFWYKVNKLAQWITEKLCFKWIVQYDDIGEESKIEKTIQRMMEILEAMKLNELELDKLATRMMIKMIEIDHNWIQLKCLNIQCNQYATKYIFGFATTGYTLVILTIPTISYRTEINISCYMVPCVRRNIIRKLRNKHVGQSFMFETPSNLQLKGCVMLEILGSQKDLTTRYDTIAVKNESDTTWEKFTAYKTHQGLQGTLRKVPQQFAAVYTGVTNSLSGWRPMETYVVSTEGGSVFPSYDPGARAVFSANTFSEPCVVSLRTLNGSTSSILNVMVDAQPHCPVRINLPQALSSNEDDTITDRMAEYMIVVREGPHEEWIKGNSVIKKTNDGFEFVFTKPWLSMEVAVKNSKILWMHDVQLRSHLEVNMIKAIVMVSQVREIASNWRQISNMLEISEDDIDLSSDPIICQEEKCFMVLERWLESGSVTFDKFTALLTSMGFKIIAEQVKSKWVKDSAQSQQPTFNTTSKHNDEESKRQFIFPDE